MGGISLGILYDSDTPGPAVNGHGVDVFSWTSCVAFDAVSTGWPAPGGGALIAWRILHEPCGTEPVPIAGYFYLGAYSPDEFKITPRPVDGKAKAADCNSNEYLLASTVLGSARFSADGLAAGFNPCGSATPVRGTSWSAIKALKSPH